MKKRGQVSIFVIIAVIIAVIAVAFVYFDFFGNGNLTIDEMKKQGREPSLSQIESFIIECQKENALEALEIIGIQGGYYEKPDLAFDMEPWFIPYYYYGGQEVMPSKSTIEIELSSFIDNNINNCLGKIDFKSFSISYSRPETTAKIQQDKVAFSTLLTATIDNNGKTSSFQLKEHPFIADSRLNEIYEVADYITTSHKENEDLICINCVVELSRQRDLYVDFIGFEDDTTLVMIIENSTSTEPYIFEFLNKYTV